MIMGKEKTILFLALCIILIGVFSNVYVYATQIDKETIGINGQEYTIDEIFFIADDKSIETIEGEKTGASLEILIMKIGVGCPSCHEYIIKAKDGYQQTVNWEILKTGVLSMQKKVFFPCTPKKFWVGDIIEIEVK
jgi:hypothetical protein